MLIILFRTLSSSLRRKHNFGTGSVVSDGGGGFPVNVALSLRLASLGPPKIGGTGRDSAL